MTSPAKFRKDKEIVAEYETQVKGKTFQSPSDVFMQHNPERFSVKSVFTLLRAVFDLTWRNASHFFCYPHLSYPTISYQA